MTDTNKKIVILLDIDGVLANMEKSVFQIYQNENPKLRYIKDNEREGMIAQIQYRKEVGQESGDIIDEIINRPNLFVNFEPFDDAIKTVKRFFTEPELISKYKIYFCTSPHYGHETCASEKVLWIRKHFGLPQTKSLIITNDKTIISADVLIDDNQTIKGFHTDEPKFKRHILMRANHNQNITEHPGGILKADWSNLFDLIP